MTACLLLLVVRATGLDLGLRVVVVVVVVLLVVVVVLGLTI